MSVFFRYIETLKKKEDPRHPGEGKKETSFLLLCRQKEPTNRTKRSPFSTHRRTSLLGPRKKRRFFYIETLKGRRRRGERGEKIIDERERERYTFFEMRVLFENDGRGATRKNITVAAAAAAAAILVACVSLGWASSSPMPAFPRVAGGKRRVFWGTRDRPCRR